MNGLSSLRSYARVVLLELFRTPAFAIPILIFPAMFFSIFALPYAKTSEIADFVLLSYIAFAIVGVTLFQFGVGVVAERGRPWERYLRTLPMSTQARFSARVLAALVFGFGAAALVAIVARIFTPVDLNAVQWLQAALYGLAGGIPFVFFGLAIGYWCNARAALPVANIFYLLLSFAGGLWIPPQMLPGLAAKISPFLPTRQFGELMWSVVNPGPQGKAILALTAYALFFAALATIGYRRDEKARYA